MTEGEDRVLSLTRVVDAPRPRVFQAYTDPALLTRWWTPRPYTTPLVEVDLRAGGRFDFTMRDPAGVEYPNRGVLLEVVTDRRIVFTDAFAEGWAINPNPFMLATIDLEDEGAATRISARVQHWTVEAREQHEAMGFHAGWGAALDQLAELLAASAVGR